MNAGQVLSNMSCCAELKDLVTSCCEKKKTGLAVYAENPGIILFSYLCALLPLASIVALDFITERWKTVRRTRLEGTIYLVSSLLPLTVVVLYIHIQRLAEDYKEMAAGITAAVLCLLHVMRTLWGLAQLHAFKRWNMHCLKVLTRMGFDFPVYVPVREVPSDLMQEVHPPRVEKSLPEKALSAFTRFFPRIMGCEKMHQFESSKWLESKTENDMMKNHGSGFPSKSEKERMEEIYMKQNTSFMHSKKQMGRIVDNHMMVNNSLLDNEFNGADIPCHPTYVWLPKVFPCLDFATPRRTSVIGANNPSTKSLISRLRELSVADFLKSKKPEECAIRWTVSFLSRFGSDWLMASRKLSGIAKGPGSDTHHSSRATGLATFIALNITHSVNSQQSEGQKYAQEVSNTQSNDGQSAQQLTATQLNSQQTSAQQGTQQISILSPLHVLCSNLQEPWISTVHVTRKNQLPYQLRGWRNSKELQLEDYSTSITKGISAWHQDFLNELDNTQKEAVEKITPTQVACFSKLIEEQNTHTLRIEKVGMRKLSLIEQQRFNTFLWQLGCEQINFEQIDGEWKKIGSTLFHALPALQKSLGTDLEYNPKLPHGSQLPDDCAILQASVQGDNWVALAIGTIPLTYDEARHEIGDDDVFKAQKEVEITRLRFEASGSEAGMFAVRKIRFLGCLMESVRSFLAFWLHKQREDSDSQGPDAPPDLDEVAAVGDSNPSPVNWTPPIPHEVCTFFCSDQLYEALQDSSHCRTSEEHLNSAEDDRSYHDSQKSLHMRLLWEIQRALIRSKSKSPDSASLMMLCMLGYPSLRVSKVGKCSGEHVFSSIAASRDSASGPGVPETRGSHVTISLDTCYKVEVVEGPQKLHITLHRSNDSKLAIVQICRNEGHEEVTNFIWQSWKDGFMGRISAQSEWRSNNLRLKNERVREEGNTSQLINGISPSVKLQDELTYWRGWPPFLSDIAGFEMQVSRIDSDVNHYNTRLNSPFDLDVELDRCLPVNHVGISNSEDTNAEAAAESGVQMENGSALALYKKGVALFLARQTDMSLNQKCVEAFVSFLSASKAEASYLEEVMTSRFCLALCYFQNYISNGRESDKRIGVQYFTNVFEPGDSSSQEVVLDIAFVLEKGYLSPRDFERVQPLRKRFSGSLPETIDLGKILKNIFSASSTIDDRAIKETESAFTIYRRLESTSSRALNRLAMMYHKGTECTPISTIEAAAMYEKAIMYATDSDDGDIGIHGINAQCNLAVLGGHGDDGECQKAIEMLDERENNWRDEIKRQDDISKQKQANAEKFEKHERGRSVTPRRELDSPRDRTLPSLSELLSRIRYEQRRRRATPMDKHSTSMNNLAVLKELRTVMVGNIPEARGLYDRAMIIDENPIAKYNLALLLAHESPEEAERLLSSVENLGADLQSMPILKAQLPKARTAVETGVIGELSFDVDQIDDCFAYVKIFSNSS